MKIQVFSDVSPNFNYSFLMQLVDSLNQLKEKISFENSAKFAFTNFG